jgi:hypothetical protein
MLRARLAHLAEIRAVTQLAHDPDAAPGGPREREFLVRQAGTLDRQTDADDAPPDLAADHVHNAAQYGLMLLAHDRDRGTTGGVVPATDPRWDEDPRGYARQDYAAWARDLR